MIKVKTIPYADFMALKPIKVSCVEDTEPREIFEINGPELDIVKAVHEVAPRHVWTLLETGAEHATVASGFHRVNRIGYYITKDPAPFEHTECEVK